MSNHPVRHVTVRFYFEPQSDDADERLAQPMEWIRAGLQDVPSVIWGEPTITVVTTTRERVLGKLNGKRRQP